jgi:peptidyl-tRNA hydrolase, PTH1 family
MSIQLIVGLGNPGVQYAKTRHNIGFMVLEELVKRASTGFLKKPNLELAEWRVGAGRLHLMKPLTFMNLSGNAVVPFAKFHKLEAHQILVVHDDLDLPFGRLRFRLGGSSGGQNGVKDITAKLGTDAFVRLKVGISRPPEGWEVVNWVLSGFQSSETALLEQVIKTAANAAIAATRDGFDKAQADFNGTDLRPKPEPVKAETRAEPSNLKED